MSEKLNWMYDGNKSTVNREEYLLGKKIDSNFEKLEAEEKGQGPVYRVEHEILPVSVARRDIGEMQVDLARKIREDPLFQIRKEEDQTLQELMDNPIKRKQLEKLKRAQEEGGENSKKKKKKADDIDKKLFAKMALLVQNDSSDSLSDDEKPKKKKNRKAKKKKHKKKETKKQRRHRNRSSSSEDSSSSSRSPSPKKKRKVKHRQHSSTESSDSNDDHTAKQETLASKHADHRSQDNRRHHYDLDGRHRTEKPRTNRHEIHEQSSSGDRTSYKCDRRQERDQTLHSCKQGDRSGDGRRTEGSDQRRSAERRPQRDTEGRRRERSTERRPARDAEGSRREQDQRERRRRADDSEEEMERKRLEMMNNAKWREQQRAVNVKRYDAERAQEEQERHRAPEEATFVQQQARAAAERGTVEQRIKANRYNIQRGSRHMDTSFVRR